MEKKILVVVSLVILLAGCRPEKQPVDYVDPMIGTGFHGHTYPGATYPFGAVQLSPDTRKGNWDACAGYHYNDNTLFGFSHTHLSGTGCIDLGDILFRPSQQTPLQFSHEQEEAAPGYYKVYLPEIKVTAELTATRHTGVHRYTYAAGTTGELIIDLDHLLDNEQIEEGWLQITSGNEVTGMRRTNGWVEDQHIFFSAVFSKPIIKSERLSERLLLLYFDTSDKTPLVCKAGLSIVSIENARLNRQEETDRFGFDFDAIRTATHAVWEKELNVITVEGGTEDEKKNFYTALYHSKIVPNVISDVNGEYRNHAQQTARVTGDAKQYSTFSTWDTFRAWHPMITLLDTTLVNHMIQSFLAIYDIRGELPLWPLSSGETHTMIGYHSASIIADAYLKGIRGYDVQKAFEAMKSSAEKNRKGAAEYIQNGFIPSDSKKESVSCLLEFAYDDWCIAQMAKELGYEEEYRIFSNRSKQYSNVFDGSTCFFRGKQADGNWEIPFNPFAIGRSYTEATAWQYRFFVPHDVYGMVQLFGGRDSFIASLDSLFTVSSEIEGELSDVTGLIGQYAHGNEPGHHIAYLYSYVGQPWKTQQWTRRLLQEMYQPVPEGICGNEDCGQMSAWYILSSLGFYPVCPGSGQFILTSPLFEKSTLALANGKFLQINANQPAKNKYITAVTLNGVPVCTPYITYEQLMQGGILEFKLAAKPDYTWGTEEENAPYSWSDTPQVSVPYISANVGLFEDSVTFSIGCATKGSVIYFTLDGSEPTPQSAVYKTPVTLKATSLIRARAFKDGYLPGKECVITATKATYKKPVSFIPVVQGVNYTYYEGYFNRVSDLGKVQPVATGTMSVPDITDAPEEDHFGYVFSGYLYIPEVGVYEFSTRSDDGSVLFIAGEKVVDNDGSHAAIDAFGRIALQKGYHPFRLCYFEDYEGEELSWSWRLPGEETFSAIPPQYLFVK